MLSIPPALLEGGSSRQSPWKRKGAKCFYLPSLPPCPELLWRPTHSPAQAARQAGIKPLARWKALWRCIIQSSKPCTEHVIRINVCPWGWTWLCSIAGSCASLRILLISSLTTPFFPLTAQQQPTQQALTSAQHPLPRPMYRERVITN